MTDFTTDRANRLDDLRGALLAAAAADLASVEAERAGTLPDRPAAAGDPVSLPRPAAASDTAPLPRPAARPARRLHLGTARARLALAVLVIAVAVPGVVIGSGLVGPERAAANGLPAGSTVMTAVQPSCTAIRESVEYECAFAESPRVGRVVRTVDASGQVDGGCRSQNAIETFWICYFGAAAVHHGVVAQEVL